MSKVITHYSGKYRYGKQKRRLTLDQLSNFMLRIKKERSENLYLGVDPLRDSSLLAMFFWSGLRLAEVVGDRARSYKVSRFSPLEREEMSRRGIDWKKQPNPFTIKTSPARPGIKKEDIEYDQEKNLLLASALALKGGHREAPLELSLDLPYVDLVKQQWERCQSEQRVWALSREYAWQIIKELDPKIYTHYFRFNRVMEFVRVSSISPAHLLSWFGWKRLQTAYNYLELGGRRIEEMSATMIQQYTGKKSEPLLAENVEEEPKEQPRLQPKKEESSLVVNPKQKSLQERLKELEAQHERGEV